MANDFDELLNNSQGGGEQAGEDPTRGLLDSLLGGMAGGDSGGQGDIGGLLGGLLGGAGGAPSGDMTDLLGGLLGGAAGGGQAAGGDMAGMLGGLLGGGSGGDPAAGGLGGLLGGLLGGMGGGSNQMSFAGGGGPALPFIGTLAEKLGISPQMANMLAMAAIGLLTSSMAKNRGQGRSGGADLASLTDPDYLRSSGVASRLSAQMGISEDDAILGLQQAMGLMAGQAGAKPATTATKKTTQKSSSAKPAAKKPSASAGTAPKKKSSSKKTASSKPAAEQPGSDFMDLLDDLTK
jgi:hypothetical protein